MEETFLEEKITELDLKELLGTKEYIIPFYQRNYAWGKDEIEQLLEDLLRFTDKEGNSRYFLGTLVVAYGKDKFEIVDGQQRHTTLSIIHSLISVEAKKNLFFEARLDNEKALDEMFGADSSMNYSGSQSLWNAKEIIETYLSNLSDEKLNKFKDAFYYKTIIYRVVLPKNTDVNHYFEIMNNRGEQLEQHEILKASFIEKIESEHEKKIFSLIWGACSNMNSLVVENFKSPIKEQLFGDDYNSIQFTDAFDSVFPEKPSNDEGIKQDSEELINTIENIVDKHTINGFEQVDNSKKNDRFGSIIDFPNFLLQVRKLSDSSVSLDDKELLKQFNYPNITVEPMVFINDLLKYRYWFDKFIIKRDFEVENRDWNWVIVNAVNSKSVVKNTFEDPEMNDKLKVVQSLFEVTFNNKNYKNWLHNILIYFKENEGINGDLHYYNFLHSRSVVLFENLRTDNPDFYNNGTNTPRFVFNYIDYLLWLRYFDEVRGEDHLVIDTNDRLLGSINNLKSQFNSFRFTQRNSVEHFMPQSKISMLDGENDSEKHRTLNSLGNLCLISGATNSSLNKDLPFAKKHSSRSKSTNESLKQQIMFECMDGESWNTKEINNHNEDIKSLLDRACEKTTNSKQSNFKNENE